MVIYRAPHHVTGFWVPVRSGSPETTGSLGAGILIEPGMEASPKSVQNCASEVGGSCVEVAPISILSREGTASVSARSSIPLGKGGAVSAFLSLAYSCEILRQRGVPCTSGEGLSRAALMAHAAEVASLTGLGDVIAMLTGGGLVVRTRPGAPGFGSAEPLRDPDLWRVEVTVAVLERPMTTPEMLRSMWDRLSEAGRLAFERFISSPSLESFLAISRDFSRRMGFLTRDLEEKILRSLGSLVAGGSVAGFYAKKSLILIFHERGAEIPEGLGRTLGGYTLRCRVSEKGFEAVGRADPQGSS